MDFSYQRGQIGLVVLLISAVLMTVGLGVASQSILESKSARQESDFSQVFNYAEQGIEEAFKSLQSGEMTLPNGYKGYSSVTESRSINSDFSVGDTAEVKLDGSTSIDITWDCPASLVVTLIDPNGGLVRYAYGLQNSNNFENIACDIPTGKKKVTGLSTAGYQLARIKVLYNNTNLLVEGDGLPIQGYNANVQVSKTSNESVALDVNAPLGAVPSIFDYVLYSGSGSIAQSP